MNIAIISDIESGGGASIAANRLALGLLQAGVNVNRIVLIPDNKTHPWKTYPILQNYLGLYRRLQHRTRTHFFPISIFIQKHWIHKKIKRLLLKLNPDIISLHNLHSGELWPSLAGICVEQAPTAWSLHDMWSFTGRCAVFNNDCRKFIDGCDETCPSPNEYPTLAPKFINKSWKLRKQVLSSNPNLVAVTPSRWLAREAQSGLWKNHQIEIIPHGIQLKIFEPLNKQLARRALGVNVSGIVLGLASVDLENKYKGTSIFLNAIQKTSIRPITILTLGEGHLTLNIKDINIQSMGYIAHERSKALFYNSLDLFIHPSLGEAWGYTVLESISCGTPVVGFPVGGLLDMVRPNKTGWLAANISVEALTDTINQAIQEINNDIDLKQNCRSVAEVEYGLDLQAQRYLHLFEEMTS